jgi:hypothetical protein
MDTISDFIALGHDPFQAACRWYDCHARDELNQLNTALARGLEIVRCEGWPADVRRTVDTLRDAAFPRRTELRSRLALSVAAWFEVAQ